MKKIDLVPVVSIGAEPQVEGVLQFLVHFAADPLQYGVHLRPHHQAGPGIGSILVIPQAVPELINFDDGLGGTEGRLRLS